MIDLKLDELTGDLDLSGGDLNLIEGDDQIEQALGFEPMLIEGDWFIDSRVGVDWFGKILGAGKDPTIRDAEIKRAILAVEGVAALVAFETSFDSASRGLSVSFTVTLESGRNVSTSIT